MQYTIKIKKITGTGKWTHSDKNGLKRVNISLMRLFLSYFSARPGSSVGFKALVY